MTGGFSPANSLKYKWKDAQGKDLSDFIQYPDVHKDGKYSKISQISVPLADWEARKSFTCELEHPKGNNKIVLTKPGKG